MFFNFFKKKDKKESKQKVTGVLFEPLDPEDLAVKATMLDAALDARIPRYMVNQASLDLHKPSYDAFEFWMGDK